MSEGAVLRIQNMLAVDESSLPSTHTSPSKRSGPSRVSAVGDSFELRVPHQKGVEASIATSPQIVARPLTQRLDRPNGEIPQKTLIAAEKILRSFNTWAFKREQPENLPLLLELISAAITCATPVSFVLYWGKGPRCSLAEPDLVCLDYLTKFADRIREVHAQGAAIKLIFTDTHARLNGHPPESTQRYFSMIEAEARQRNFDTCYLGQLTEAEQAQNQNVPPAAIVPLELLQTLSVSARKWFNGEGTAEEAALKYYRMNMGEKRAVEFAFPGSIFVTFNGSELRDLFPENLPIFYMYSLRRGTAVKPWFILDDSAHCAHPACGCYAASSISGGADKF